MLSFLCFIAALLALAYLVQLHLRFWIARAFTPRWPDERHFVETSDGWRLALNRYRPAQGPAGGQPVLCCPGLACNARLFDLDAEHSLARHLAAQGFDVWCLDLRGTGASERPAWGGRTWAFGFSDYRQDGTAALAAVVAKTGREVLWVGHSMGGLIGYQVAAASRSLRAIATLGSPLDLRRHRESLGSLAPLLRYFFPFWPVSRLRTLSALALPLTGRVHLAFERVLYHVPNLSGLTLRGFIAAVVEDVPRQLLDEFEGAVFRELGMDGRPVEQALAPLASLTQPLLTLAGRQDGMAPPASVEAIHHYAKSASGEAKVLAPEYGHLDLLLGERASTEVFPELTAWLLRHTV